MVDPQLFIDRLLETENLTDYLEDDDADYLIHWGIIQLKGIIAEAEDLATAGEMTNNLMGFMRTLNQTTGHLHNIQQNDLVRLADYHQKTFGPGRDLAPGDYLEATSQLKAMTPRQALDYLLNWLLLEENPSSNESTPSQESSTSEDSTQVHPPISSEE